MYLVIFMIIFSCISSSLNHELEDVRADSDCLPRRAWTGPRCLPDCLAWSPLPVDSDPLAQSLAASRVISPLAVGSSRPAVTRRGERRRPLGPRPLRGELLAVIHDSNLTQ